jgi:hypothetical protein
MRRRVEKCPDAKQEANREGEDEPKRKGERMNQKSRRRG